jgi:hypothetical protein
VADRTPLSLAAGQTQELSVGYLAKARGVDRGLLLVETCGDRCGVTVQLLDNAVRLQFPTGEVLTIVGITDVQTTDYVF